MSKTLTAKLITRNDTAANWAASNPILAKGEIGIESDSRMMKIGDGVKNWSTLSYMQTETAMFVNGHTVEADVPVDAKFTDTTYDDTEISNLISGLNSQLANKVDKEDGRGLSSNDYTLAEKNKLTGIAAGAEVNVQSDWTATDTASDAYIKNKPASFTPAAHSHDERYYTEAEMDAKLASKLDVPQSLTTGNIDMCGHQIGGLAPATSDSGAVTLQQLNSSIAGLGTVFDLKGAKATTGDLPTTGNSLGDVWFVESESAEYLWIQPTTGNAKWEKLGPSIDLSGYLTKAGLLQATGSATNNTMSQNAITTALNSKLNATDVLILNGGSANSTYA